MSGRLAGPSAIRCKVRLNYRSLISWDERSRAAAAAGPHRTGIRIHRVARVEVAAGAEEAVPRAAWMAVVEAAAGRRQSMVGAVVAVRGRRKATRRTVILRGS